ncbi:MAG: outer membrane beta-barrel protein, partial [Methylobacterium sp.]
TLQSGVLDFSNSSGNEGFVGGGQIGYNYQFTPGSGVVVGIEADAQYADFGRQRNRFSAIGANGAAIVPGTLIFNPNGLSGLDYFGTVRGRLGYAFDRTLFYATGGFAYGAGGGRQFGSGVSSDDFQTGYAVGGGIEYALPTDSFLNFFRSSAVTVKVEGLYVNLDRNRNAAGAFATNNLGQLVTTGSQGVTVVAGPANIRRDTEFAVIRAGVNYKFGTY